MSLQSLSTSRKQIQDAPIFRSFIDQENFDPLMISIIARFIEIRINAFEFIHRLRKHREKIPEQVYVNALPKFSDFTPLKESDVTICQLARIRFIEKAIEKGEESAALLLVEDADSENILSKTEYIPGLLRQVAHCGRMKLLKEWLPYCKDLTSFATVLNEAIEAGHPGCVREILNRAKTLTKIESGTFTDCYEKALSNKESKKLLPHLLDPGCFDFLTDGQFAEVFSQNLSLTTHENYREIVSESLASIQRLPTKRKVCIDWIHPLARLVFALRGHLPNTKGIESEYQKYVKNALVKQQFKDYPWFAQMNIEQIIQRPNLRIVDLEAIARNDLVECFEIGWGHLAICTARRNQLLCLAAEHGSRGMVQKLLFTPLPETEALQGAIDNGAAANHFDVVEILLPLCLKEIRLDQVLYSAGKYGNIAFIERLLLIRTFDTKALTSTILVAAESGHNQIVQRLVLLLDRKTFEQWFSELLDSGNALVAKTLLPYVPHVAYLFTAKQRIKENIENGYYGYGRESVKAKMENLLLEIEGIITKTPPISRDKKQKVS